MKNNKKHSLVNRGRNIQVPIRKVIIGNTEKNENCKSTDEERNAKILGRL